MPQSTFFQKPICLSASSLSLFLECPRCFWLQINQKIHRPEGPISTLPRGMDNVIKDYFDQYRAKGVLPPELEGKIKGKLVADQGLIKKWRHWMSGLSYTDSKRNAKLISALDDCLIDSSGSYIPLDYKTRGYDLKIDSCQYYQHQLDIYTFLLSVNGFKIKNLGYLVYYIPKKIKEHGQGKFDVILLKIKTDALRAKTLFEQAVNLLRGEIPAKHSDCKFCSFSEHTREFL